MMPRYWLAVVVCLSSAEVPAYELSTHARISYQAYLASTFEKSQYLFDGLGLSDEPSVFGESYIDSSGSEIFVRRADGFEKGIIQNGLKLVEEVSTIKGWLMRGAIREDDVPIFFGDNPQDDPFGQIFRVVNHFYDPIKDRPLTVLGLVSGEKAPDWAIGAADVFADENRADGFRRNHFTVFDAHEALYRALTGLSGGGSAAIGEGGATPATPVAREALRKAYWATTFRALGDLVHLIQDMAQPQHTRNDAHAGSDDYTQPAGPIGHKSFYEGYIDERARTGAADNSNGSRRGLRPLVYGGYPVPAFNDYVSYFSVRHKLAAVGARTGLADYSNRGFFSVGKNLGQGEYDLPPNTLAAYSPQPRVIDSRGNSVDLLYGTVSDAFTGASDTVPLTTWGAWNEAAQTYGVGERFSLIRENYDAMADLLIPRAVAYSAGLINRFFRGRLEISPPDEGVYAIVDHALTNGVDDGFTRLKLKLRNATPDVDDGQATYPQAMTAGTLRAVAKYRRNGCYQPDLSGEPGLTSCDLSANRTTYEEVAVSQSVTVASLSATQPQAFSFDFSANPIPLNATDLYLQVVYRGGLGSEADAVVVATRDIAEPTYLSLANYTDYYLLDGVFYRPQTILDTPSLFKRIDSDRDGQYNPAIDVNIDPLTLAYVVNFGGPTVATLSVPPARFSRFAFLVDGPSVSVNILKQSFGYWISPSINTNRFQFDPATGTVKSKGFGSSRGFNWQVNFPDWKWLGSTSQGDTSTLADLADPTPVPVQLDF